MAATVVMYLINVIAFNEIHLRRKNERLSWKLILFYYVPYKIVLTCINVASCYWSVSAYRTIIAFKLTAKGLFGNTPAISPDATPKLLKTKKQLESSFGSRKTLQQELRAGEDV